MRGAIAPLILFYYFYKMIYVYQHIRRDTNEIFYIGIGNKRRPYSKTKRNKYWNNIVNKYGYEVEIVRTCNNTQEASDWEQFLISFYGRKDLGKGNLVNMSDGGIGYYNPSEEFKKSLSDRWSGEGNPWYGKSRKGKDNPCYGKKFDLLAERNRKMSGENHPFYGKKRPEVSAKLSGENNYWYGKERNQELKDAVSKAQSKPVIDTITGKIYKNSIEAAKSINMNISTFRAKITGRLKNNTNLRYL